MSMERSNPTTNDNAAVASFAPVPTSQQKDEEEEQKKSQGDIPFLVTHWLENLGEGGKKDGGSGTTQAKKEALQRIRRATSEIASVFAELGMYGTTNRPCFSNSLSSQLSRQDNATYSDLSRQWSGLSQNHLENLVHSVAATNSVADTAARTSATTNLLDASREALRPVQEGEKGGAGRSSQDAILVDDDGAAEDGKNPAIASSALQTPVLLSANPTMSHSPPTTTTTGNPKLSGDAEALMTTEIISQPLVALRSNSSAIDEKTSLSMRRVLSLREKIHSDDDEIRSLHDSIVKQEEASRLLAAQRTSLLAKGEADPAQMIAKLEEIKDGGQNCNRVIAQLRRRLLEVESSNNTRKEELQKAEAEAHSWYKKGREIRQNYRDPFRGMDQCHSFGSRVGGNSLLLGVLDRQRGIARPRHGNNSRIDLTGRFPKSAATARTRKKIFSTRLSHAATINTHLNYPVYCLRFDRTGRYFITGADDYLIKVHYLGAGQSCRNKNIQDGSRQLRCNYGANTRGSVLVCSLRGHAGVINDIDVSSDNCFLATASVDGDCRIWGLKDGCPVAILRGHKGGANMVSWSTLTPYRLITTGSDGFARMWDIREACLKRYGAGVGQRPEYRLQLTEKERRAEKVETASKQSAQPSTSQNILPPLPVRETSATSPVAAALAPAGDDPSQPTGGPPHPMVIAPPPLPPLPPLLPPAGVDGGQPNGNAADANGGGADDNIVLGQFTANDKIDEGVKLLTKYQHGAPGGAALGGPGTRSRRSAVNVICVARCPIGGHFTTGSDDGICRVWEDSDDCCVGLVDKRFSHTVSGKMASRPETRSMSRSSNSDTPLLKLMGHVSAITDLAYSHMGDRLLSASQRDGVVRVWSLGMKLASLAAGGDSIVERGVTQIVIKLTNPLAGPKTRAQQSRRKGPGNSGRAEASKVSCDVAVWSHGDTRIVTSQSILVKQSGTEIQPGSQYLFLWESRTGHCLLGISGAHTMQCPVVIPHPTDLSLMCSAGADGMVHVWDWESGRCIFTHKNKVDFGPLAENNNRLKISGYLDGAFSPDGTGLVLTDDNGRITILDSLVPSGTTAAIATETWIREQYFANDYYELFYDTNGYCIERGSEQPPHLAPKGVRSTHAGVAYPADISEAFKDLVGPLPLPDDACRWRRDLVRSRSQRAANCKEDFSKSRCSKVRSGVREFDPVNTILIKGPGHVEAPEKGGASLKGPPRTERPGPGSTESGNIRNFSSNFRWGDYDDLMRAHGNDDDENDSDDEEFEPAAPTANVANNDDDSEDLDPDDVQGDDSPFRVRQRQGGRSTGRSAGVERSTGVERSRRAQRRSQRRDTEFVEIGSDDEMVAQFVSTNRTPSGSHVRDYNITGHLWRLTGAANVNRAWLRRYESTSSYTGRKIYSPQVGDSLVYIPRAHFETIKEFPSLTPPWQSWPQGTAWPVIRCSVRKIRYRFPYEDYYRRDQTSTCKSIVAILSLELTGIPELSENRDFPWPKPSFVNPTRSHLFELSIFENDKCEFVIPEALYTSRLKSLERKLVESNFSFEGLGIHLFYSNPELNEEDQEMQLYPAAVQSVGEEDPQSDPHLRGSGFGVLKVDCEDYDDNFSPWEIMVDEATPDRPGLSEEDMKVISDGLRAQMQKPSVREYFANPVDMERYSDYLNMIEIPMDLSFIKRRLQSDYYATKWSVVADTKLIHDNCVKYNGDGGSLSRVAKEMYEEFERQVLSEAERGEARLQSPPTLRIRVGTRSEAQNNQNDSNSRTTDNRARTRRNSSLEDLPLPQGAPSSPRTTRREGETLPGTRALRSREPAPETEVLGRVLRNRSTIHSGVGDLPNGSAYAEESPKADESMDEDDHVEGAEQEMNGDAGEAGDEDAERSSDSSDDEGAALVAPSRRSKRVRVPTQNDHSLETEGEPASPRRALRSHDGSNRNALSSGDAHVATRSRGASRPSRRQGTSGSGRMLNSSRGKETRDEGDTESPSFDEENESEVSEQEENWDDAEDESDDEVDDDDAALPQTPPSRSRARPDAQQRNVRSRRGAPPPISLDSEPLSPRRSHRMLRTPQASYEEPTSDFEPDNEYSEEESEEDPTPSRRSGRRKNPTYAELPSDYDESDQESDDSTNRRATKAPPKRRRGPSSSSKAKSKRLKSEENLDLPQVKGWPAIEIKDITAVAHGIVERVKSSDNEDAFAVPVLETYPDLAAAYSNVVSQPMDLRTIEEDRIFEYGSIKELQEDLILIFRNCCTFNAPGSYYWIYAKNIWESLNDIFREVCEEAGVLLPRRF